MNWSLILGEISKKKKVHCHGGILILINIKFSKVQIHLYVWFDTYTMAILWNLIKFWDPCSALMVYCCLNPGKKQLSRAPFYMLQRCTQWIYRMTPAGDRLKDETFLFEGINVLKYYVKCTNLKQLLKLNLVTKGQIVWTAAFLSFLKLKKITWVI